MYRRIIPLLVCLISLSAAANAGLRPMVGFLPFEGPRGSLQYAIPQVTYWQLSCIPGMDRTDLGPIMDCVRLDRLEMPRSLADTLAYARLAANLGTDFIITGRIENQDKSRVRFRVILFSAADPAFRKEHVHQCHLSELMRESTGVAKEIAADVGVLVESHICFDTHEVAPKALRVFDESVALDASIEADASDRFYKSRRLAQRAEALCPSNTMVREWALSFADDDTERLDALQEMHAKCPNNIALLADTTGLCWDLDKRPEATRYAKDWLKLDPTSLGARVAAKGTTRLPRRCGWRSKLMLASSYEMVNDIKNVRLLLESAMNDRPNSAYVHYSAGRTLSDASDDASAIAEFEAALKANPTSYRLRIKLVWANGYLRRYQDAQEALNLALRRWPGRSEPHLYAARLYRARKQYDKAAAEMRVVQRCDPDTDVSDEIAQDYRRSGNVLGSVRELSATKPGFREAIAIIAGVLMLVFLLAVAGVAILVRAVLNRDAKPKAQ